MWLETTAQVSDSIPPTQSLDHLMNYSPPACLLSCFSWVWFFVTLWTVAYQVPLSMGFSKQRYCSGLPCLTPGHLLDPGVEPVSPMSPALQVDSLLLSHWQSSVQFSCSVVSESLRPHGLEHSRPPCLSPTPGVYLNPCPSSWWCHPTISSPVVPFSSSPQPFPASGHL